MNSNELWRAALGEIELQVSKANFKTWLQNTSIVDKNGGVVVVSVPNSFTKEWLENKYHKFILRSLRNLESDIKEVVYQINQNPLKSDVKDKKTTKEDSQIIKKQLDFNFVITLSIKTETGLIISNPKVKIQSSAFISATSSANFSSAGIPFSIYLS